MKGLNINDVLFDLRHHCAIIALLEQGYLGCDWLPITQCGGNNDWLLKCQSLEEKGSVVDSCLASIIRSVR